MMRSSLENETLPYGRAPPICRLIEQGVNLKSDDG